VCRDPENLALPGFDPRNVQPVTTRCTDYRSGGVTSYLKVAANMDPISVKNVGIESFQLICIRFKISLYPGKMTEVSSFLLI
jgi:hypothetical protein